MAVRDGCPRPRKRKFASGFGEEKGGHCEGIAGEKALSHVL